MRQALRFRAQAASLGIGGFANRVGHLGEQLAGDRLRPLGRFRWHGRSNVLKPQAAQLTQRATEQRQSVVDV
jgi:hypothetical protein